MLIFRRTLHVTAHFGHRLSAGSGTIRVVDRQRGSASARWKQLGQIREEFTRLYDKAKADGLMLGDILITLEMTDDAYEAAEEQARERSMEEVVKRTVLAGCAPAEQTKKLIDEFLRKRAEAKGKRM